MSFLRGVTRTVEASQQPLRSANLTHQGYRHAAAHREMDFCDGIDVANQLFNGLLGGVVKDFCAIFDERSRLARRIEISLDFDADFRDRNAAGASLTKDVVAVTSGEREHQQLPTIGGRSATFCLRTYGDRPQDPAGANGYLVSAFGVANGGGEHRAF